MGHWDPSLAFCYQTVSKQSLHISLEPIPLASRSSMDEFVFHETYYRGWSSKKDGFRRKVIAVDGSEWYRKGFPWWTVFYGTVVVVGVDTV